MEGDFHTVKEVRVYWESYWSISKVKKHNFTDTLGDYKVKLPNLKKQYRAINNEIFMQGKDRLYILFDANIVENYRKRVSCNIDYNNINGLQGLELILTFDVRKQNKLSLNELLCLKD